MHLAVIMGNHALIMNLGACIVSKLIMILLRTATKLFGSPCANHQALHMLGNNLCEVGLGLH